MAHQLANITAHFNRAADSYETAATLQQLYVAEGIAMLAPHMAGHASLADIGCGTGMVAKEAKAQGYHWHITGVDIAAAMCKQARQQQTHTIQANMHHLPLQDNRFDATCSTFALQWSNTPEQAITELARITKPSGYLLLLSFLEGTLHELHTTCEQMSIPQKTNQFHSARDYQQWFNQTGLTCVEEQITQEHTYYPAVDALFDTLKQMGATNSNPASIKGLGNRHALDAIRQTYHHQFEQDGIIPASWNIGCWLLRK